MVLSLLMKLWIDVVVSQELEDNVCTDQRKTHKTCKLIAVPSYERSVVEKEKVHMNTVNLSKGWKDMLYPCQIAEPPCPFHLYSRLFPIFHFIINILIFPSFYIIFLTETEV